MGYECLMCGQPIDQCDCTVVPLDRWEAAKSAWLNLRALVSSADLDILFFQNNAIDVCSVLPPVSEVTTGSESIS